MIIEVHRPQAPRRRNSDRKGIHWQYSCHEFGTLTARRGIPALSLIDNVVRTMYYIPKLELLDCGGAREGLTIIGIVAIRVVVIAILDVVVIILIRIYDPDRGVGAMRSDWGGRIVGDSALIADLSSVPSLQNAVLIISNLLGEIFLRDDPPTL
jgi:hypothetical protein